MEPCVTRFYSQPGPHRAVSVAHGRVVELSLYHNQIVLRYTRGWAMPAGAIATARVFINPEGSVYAYLARVALNVVPLDAPAVPPALVDRWLSFLPRLWATKMYQPMYDWMAEELPTPYCFWPSDPLRVFRELAPGYVFLEDEG